MSIPKTHNGKSLKASWIYCAKDGAPLGVVGRYQNGTDKKYVLPFFRRNCSGFAAGIDMNPRPLFGLEKLAAHAKDKAVFIVEGEKSAAALQQLGICAVTSLGGSSAAKQADWTPLSGYKTVYLMPDNDSPGQHYAKDVYTALSALDSPPVVKVLNLAGLPDGGDVVDWIQGIVHGWGGYAAIPVEFHTTVKQELLLALSDAEPVPEEWGLVGLIGSHLGDFAENPIEINVSLKPVMPFNMDLLPEAFRPWVMDIAHRMQCPPDFVAVAVMVALSAVIGKKGLIHPKQHDDWTVCPNLWGLNVGRPSVMKTPAANEGIKPLQRLEIVAKGVYEAAKDKQKARGFIDKEGRALAEKQARELIKAKKFAEAEQILLENPDEQIAPPRERFLVNDCTIEKLGELLNENPNGLMLYRDEIIGFLRTIDKEERANDRAFYLECFNGLNPYTFDRIGRGTVDIESTCVAMLGNIQPGVLRPYLSKANQVNGAGDDGMIQRFQLMVWPDVQDWQHIDRWPDTQAKNHAFEVFERLANWVGFNEPARFGDEAQTIFNQWFCGLHERLRADDINQTLEAHYSKYKSLVPSLAVIVHLADNPHHSPIVGADAITKAIAWAEYLESHAERIYGAALDAVDANAKTILSKIESGRLSDNFNSSDVKPKKIS